MLKLKLRILGNQLHLTWASQGQSCPILVKTAKNPERLGCTWAKVVGEIDDKRSPCLEDTQKSKN